MFGAKKNLRVSCAAAAVDSSLCYTYSRLDRFCMGKFQMQNGTPPIVERMCILIRNNFFSTTFQNFEC
jgi:hypothetical protein